MTDEELLRIELTDNELTEIAESTKNPTVKTLVAMSLQFREIARDSKKSVAVLNYLRDTQSPLRDLSHVDILRIYDEQFGSKEVGLK
jgi:hypothetical protein